MLSHISRGCAISNRDSLWINLRDRERGSRVKPNSLPGDPDQDGTEFNSWHLAYPLQASLRKTLREC